MRRMLDPTTLGGGGGDNLYLHCITLYDFTPDVVIAINFYSKNNENVNTIESLEKYLLGAEGVVCNGYRKIGDHYAIVNRIGTMGGESLVAYYLDLTNGSKDAYYLSHADSIQDTPILVK